MTAPVNGSDDRPRSKVEDEVLEILMKNDRPPSNVVKFQAKVIKSRYTLLQRVRRSLDGLNVTTTHLLLATVALAVFAALLHGSSPFLGQLLAIASLISLVLLFIRGVTGPRRQQTKRWRGRDIDLSSPGRPEWLERWTRDRGPKR